MQSDECIEELVLLVPEPERGVYREALKEFANLVRAEYQLVVQRDMNAATAAIYGNFRE